MSEFVWYCPLCQSEGSDPKVEFCENDGARVKPIAERGAAWIGRVLDDKYRIEKFIDAGGTAEVFEAERISSGKRVAVKLLHAAFADSTGALDRFMQEAQLVSRIAHPNVVDILDFGTLPESVHYMVMELLSGRSLAAELLAGPVPVSLALKIAMQACEGLAAAHERDVIHCDVKPANLFLQKTPGRDEVTVKILDLGIGRLFATTPNSGLVDSGLIAGTPDYMSPEQATALPLGPATDIYAMGIVLYEMLLGTVPFEDASYTNVLARQVNEIPVWRMDVATARGIPAEAGPIVLRALAKDPRERHGSMVDLQRDLAALAGIVRGRKLQSDRPTVQNIAPRPPSNPASARAPTPAFGARRPTVPPVVSARRSGPPAGARTPTPAVVSDRPRISITSRFERVPLSRATGSDDEIVEVAPDVFWVGRRHGAALECNVYLRVFRRGGTELSVLVDPGPPMDFDVISAKVASVIGSLRRLDFVFINHQDPDVSGNAAAIQAASPRAHVMCSEDTWRLVHAGGLDPKRFSPTERFPGGVATLATGHEITFVPTPFCHFRGAVMLYDPASRVLFSGDLLGGAHAQSMVAAGGRWWAGVEMFHQIYMPSSRALALAATRIKRLTPSPSVIAPQHGSLIVGEQVSQAVDAVATLTVGLDVFESTEQDPRFLAAANDILREYTDVGGVQQARRLMEAYGQEGSFTSPFVLRGALEIVGFKVAPFLAVEALATDMLSTLTAVRRGDFQRSLAAIRKQHGLDVARSSRGPGFE